MPDTPEVTFTCDRILVAVVVARLENGVKVGEQSFNTPPFFHPYDIPSEVFDVAEAQAKAAWESGTGA